MRLEGSAGSLNVRSLSFSSKGRGMRGRMSSEPLAGKPPAIVRVAGAQEDIGA